MRKENLTMFLIFRVAAAVLLVYALGEGLSYDYFTFLRYATTGVALWSSFVASKNEKIYWSWVMMGVAILFNPIFPIHLDRQIWKTIDLFTAIIFGISIFTLRPKSRDDLNTNQTKNN